MRFIITADWHLRASRPRCRNDEDWMKTQKIAVQQIVNCSIKNEIPVFIVGDIFHSYSDTNFECIQIAQKGALGSYYGFYILAGNHDLMYHSSENIEKSAIGILIKSDNIDLIKNYKFDCDFSAENFDGETENKEIIFKHVLCFPDLKSLPPNVDAITAKELLEEYSEAKWIFTGDYHQNFHYEKNGRHVVNPGCLLRQVADLKDYQTGFYIVDTESEKVEFIPIIDEGAEFIDDSYITREKEKEERIEAFAEKLNETSAASLDFIENVQNKMLETKINPELKNVIEELLEV